MRRQRLDNSNQEAPKGEGPVTGTGSSVCQSSAPIFPPRAMGSWAWTGTHWLDDDVAALRSACDAKISVERAADHLGRSPASVAHRARDMGLVLPSPWRSIIAPRRAIIRTERLAFPYVITRRPENEMLLAVNALIPPALPEWIRADIGQTVMLEILEGKVAIEALSPATIFSFIRRIKRENWDYQTISLDAPVRGTDDLRIIDTLAAPEIEEIEDEF